MEILFVPLEGVPLYQTLIASETSRGILQFYSPQDLGFAVRVRTASLGTALSLVSELRWYVRRYMREVLFEIGEGIYATHALAEEIYTREREPSEADGHRYIFIFREGEPLQVIPLKAGVETEKARETADGADLAIEVYGPLKEGRYGD